MTSLESLAQSLSNRPTVKCSTCEADVELAKLADHNCSPVTNVTQTTLTAEPSIMDEQQAAGRPNRGASLYQRQRPILPKIDSNIPNRPPRGLDPREAASIAHDLGLPSPISAGPGRRSPRSPSSRKGSSQRIPLAPPSPELPTSQDCAFPPFPLSKPKRTQTEKESRPPKPRSASRANTHDSSLSHSASSSMYSSTSSYFTKRRISDTSSNQRSRQGTLNEVSTPPSTAPSSPRESLDGRAPSTTEPVANGYGNQDEDILHSPLSHTISYETSTRPVTAEHESLGNVSHRPGEPQHQDHEMEQAWEAERNNTTMTFDRLLSTNPSHILSRTTSNQKSSSQSQQPQAIDQTAVIPEERRFPAIGVRSPTAASAGGLGRTLTSLFRKKSLSANSKKPAQIDINSPRMRALAPEPPPVPPKQEDELDNQHADQLQLLTQQHDASPSIESPASAMISASSVASTNEVTTDDLTTATPLTPLDQANFDFKFGNGDEEEANRMDKADSTTVDDFGEVLASMKPSNQVGEDRNINRASIDSASSYGSVRYSQQTESSRSSLPFSHDPRHMSSSVLHSPSESLDLRGKDASTDKQSDSLLDHRSQTRRLSPVDEMGPVTWAQQLREPPSPEQSNEKARKSTLRTPSPLIASGNKGTCRGCSNTILSNEKSVSSKDGRLTGRYHKRCFVCRSCDEPFATADFYVFEDQPYCGHHYHVVNNTLCAGCGNGIEGHYLETFDIAENSSKKFHPRCLTCATCRVQLKEDYFEYNGHVYCERDAFRANTGPRSPYDTAPARPSPLVREVTTSGVPSTKGRFPERRTTKLMMT